MAEKQEGKLPQLPKRTRTEGNCRKERFHFSKESQYFKERNAVLRNRFRMVSLYARHHLPQQQQKSLLSCHPQHRFSFQLQKQRQVPKTITSVAVPTKQTPSQTIQNVESQVAKQQQSSTEKEMPAHHPQQFTFNSVVLSHTEQFYLANLKGKNIEDHHIMDQFCSILVKNNSFFTKINPAITEGLLRLGTISSFSPGELICKERPVERISFLLWGHALLKKKATGLRLGLPTGSCLGQDGLLDRQEEPLQQYFSRGERCRAVSSCGMLTVGEKELKWLCQQFTTQGMKDEVQRFKSILFRIYLRKKEARELAG